jgi:hypothetical protein
MAATAARYPNRSARAQLPLGLLAAAQREPSGERADALRALAYLAGGQLGLVALLALSLALLPQGVAQHEALSYYGAQATTVAPYTLAFLSAALGTQGALRLLPARPEPLRRLRSALRAIVILLLAVLVTPYTGESALDGLHTVFATALFATATALALWLAARVLDDRLTRTLAAIQVASGLLVLLSQTAGVHQQAAGELLFVLAFGLLLIRSLTQLLALTPSPPPMWQPDIHTADLTRSDAAPSRAELVGPVIAHAESRVVERAAPVSG